jgi:VWFA-related protein
MRRRRNLLAAIVLLVLLHAEGASQSRAAQESAKQVHERASPRANQSSNRNHQPLFKNKPGQQNTEIYFDRATGNVTLKLLVQDPNGNFIPDIRRENFAVYENGIRQSNATVEIERAPASLALLMEFGGTSPSSIRIVAETASQAGHELVGVLGKDDKLAIFKYGDKVEEIADFSKGREAIDTLLLSLGEPEISEANLFDALISTVTQLQPVPGRKAIVLISSGVDTFSRANLENVCTTLEHAGFPVYAISVIPALRQNMATPVPSGPVARIDWSKAENNLQKIATASGGREYAPETTIDLPPLYDDMLDNLKLRYVVTYKSSNTTDLSSPRTVRVELVDPTTGGPLQIVDPNGRKIKASVVAQHSFVPNAAAPK